VRWQLIYITTGEKKIGPNEYRCGPRPKRLRSLPGNIEGKAGGGRGRKGGRFHFGKKRSVEGGERGEGIGRAHNLPRKRKSCVGYFPLKESHKTHPGERGILRGKGGEKKKGRIKATYLIGSRRSFS